MSKLSELKPGQKVAFSPIHNKSQKLTGEIADYAFLAVIKNGNETFYAHADDIDVLEQPKPTLSADIQTAIHDAVTKAVASTPAPTAFAPEWEEAAPAASNKSEEEGEKPK